MSRVSNLTADSRRSGTNGEFYLGGCSWLITINHGIGFDLQGAGFRRSDAGRYRPSGTAEDAQVGQFAIKLRMYASMTGDFIENLGRELIFQPQLMALQA
jgi:hypothetical protein